MLLRYRDALRADAWLFCDGPNHQSGQQQVQLGVRGVTGVDITVFGPTRPLHSGHYGNWAPNPGALIANLIASMRDDDGRIKVAHFYDDVRPISASEKKAIDAIPPVDVELRRSLDCLIPRRTTPAGEANHASRVECARHSGWSCWRSSG